MLICLNIPYSRENKSGPFQKLPDFWTCLFSSHAYSSHAIFGRAYFQKIVHIFGRHFFEISVNWKDVGNVLKKSSKIS